MDLTNEQQAQFEADPNIQAALELGFNREQLTLPQEALAGLVSRHMKDLKPKWRESDKRWSRWSRDRALEVETVQAAGTAMRLILADRYLSETGEGGAIHTIQELRRAIAERDERITALEKAAEASA